MKLLDVDDDPPLQTALLRLLGQWGYATEQASTAAAALAWLERELFDLGLLERHEVARTKPGALAPGVCLLSRGFSPWFGPKGGRTQLCQGCSQETAGCGNSLIVIRSEGLGLWGGAAGAGTWGQVSIGTFHWIRGT